MHARPTYEWSLINSAGFAHPQLTLFQKLKQPWHQLILEMLRHYVVRHDVDAVALTV